MNLQKLDEGLKKSVNWYEKIFNNIEPFLNNFEKVIYALKKREISTYGSSKNLKTKY